MAKLEELKNEIRAVDELTELSSALEQTAARDIAQMRERIIKSRPFFQEAWRIYKVIQAVTPKKPEVVNKHLVVLVTLEWGMTGGLLNRVVRRAEKLYDHYEADLLIAGKMGREKFASRSDRTIHYFDVPKHASFGEIDKLNKVVAGYAFVHFVYPQFRTLGKQEVMVSSLESAEGVGETKKDDVESIRFTIEPSPQVVIDYVSEAVVGMVMYNYSSEGLLAYSAAQMIAMRSAHDNAKEEKKRLTFRFNKARREQIDIKLREQYGSRMHVGEDQGATV